MVIIALIGMIVFVISYVGVKEFRNFREAAERCVLGEAAAKDLQDASHYLAEKARLYALTGEKEYMLAHFTETDVTRRREKALEQPGESAADSSFKRIQRSLCEAGNRRCAADCHGTCRRYYHTKIDRCAASQVQ